MNRRTAIATIAAGLVGLALAPDRAAAREAAVKTTEGGAIVVRGTVGLNSPIIAKPPSIESYAEAAARAYASAYGIVPLTPLPDFPEARPEAINNHGQIVGASTKQASNLGHAVLWDGGPVHDLGTLGGVLSSARDINDAGVVVGSAWTAERQAHAFVWDGHAMRDLDPAGRDSAAAAINGSGQIVGYQSDNAESSHAVMWDSDRVQRLETFESGYSHPVALTDAGQVLLIHYGSSPEGRTESYLWVSGGLINLGRFEATGLNASLEVVGYGGRPLLNRRAWLWRDGTMYDIGTLGGEAIPWAINDLGQVVGSSYTEAGAEQAFIWDGGVVSDLNGLIPADSGWVLSRATAINNTGQIVGFGYLNGHHQAFLLSPYLAVACEETGVLARR